MGNASITYFRFQPRKPPTGFYKCIGGFGTNQIEIVDVRIASENGEKYYYMAIEGHPDDRQVQLALEELGFFSTTLEIIHIGDRSEPAPSDYLSGSDPFEPAITPQYRSIPLAAAYLSSQIEKAIDDLAASKPNDDEDLEKYAKLVQFYKSIDRQINEISELSQSKNGELLKTKATRLSETINDFWQGLVDDKKLSAMTDTLLIGGGYMFLALCGMPAAFAAPTAIASFASPKLIRSIKSFFRQSNDRAE